MHAARYSVLRGVTTVFHAVLWNGPESLLGRIDTNAHAHFFGVFCSQSLDSVRHFLRWQPYRGTASLSLGNTQFHCPCFPTIRNEWQFPHNRHKTGRQTGYCWPLSPISLTLLFVLTGYYFTIFLTIWIKKKSAMNENNDFVTFVFMVLFQNHRLLFW